MWLTAFDGEYCLDGAGRQEGLEEEASKQGTAQHRNICFTEKICQWRVWFLFLSKIIMPFPWAQLRQDENYFTQLILWAPYADKGGLFPSLCFCILSFFRGINSTCILNHPYWLSHVNSRGWWMAFSYHPARKAAPSVRLIHRNCWTCPANIMSV